MHVAGAQEDRGTLRGQLTGRVTVCMRGAATTDSVQPRCVLVCLRTVLCRATARFFALSPDGHMDNRAPLVYLRAAAPQTFSLHTPFITASLRRSQTHVYRALLLGRSPLFSRRIVQLYAVAALQLERRQLHGEAVGDDRSGGSNRPRRWPARAAVVDLHALRPTTLLWLPPLLADAAPAAHSSLLQSFLRALLLCKAF